jgi:hypothetical protein
MRALEPEVVDGVRAAVEPLLPHRIGPIPSVATDPGSRTGSASGGILVRLVTGSSWVEIEAILDRQVADTTLRARRDEWIAAGVFEHLKAEAMAAFDREEGEPPRSARRLPGATPLRAIVSARKASASSADSVGATSQPGTERLKMTAYSS